MRTVPTFTFSILTLASLEAAAALSATVPPAWLKAEVAVPEHSRLPLVVKLSPDMTPCRAKYGNEAASKCSRLFGLVSSRVTGVSLSPAVEGVWRWEARGALAFTPEEDVEFDVVYEDDAIVVVNKPAGLVVHPGAGHTCGPQLWQKNGAHFLGGVIGNALVLGAADADILHPQIRHSFELLVKVLADLIRKTGNFFVNTHKTHLIHRSLFSKLNSTVPGL